MSLAQAGKVETSLSSSIHYNDVDDALYGATYHYMKLQPYVQPTLSLTSTSSMEIQLPPSVVYNLSKSRLEFDVLKPALAGFVNVYSQGYCGFIESVQLFAGNGKELCSVNDVGFVSKMLLPCHTSLEKLLSNSEATADAQTLAEVDKHHVIYRSDAVPGPGDIGGARAIGGVAGRTPDDGAKAYTGISNYVSSNAVGRALALRVSLPLADLLPGTILALNKDIAPGEVWRLVIRFSASQTWGFEATDLNFAGSRQFTVSPTISNAWVQCAIVSDEVLASRIKEKTQSEGVVLNMPQLWVERMSTNQQGHYIQNRKFNSGHGKNLIRTFYAVFNGANQANGSTNYQNYNVGSMLYSSIRTQLDQRFNQPGDLVRADGDIWMYLAPKLRGSAIQAFRELDQRAVFFDDWTPNACKDWNDALPAQQGLSLAQEREVGFDVNLTTANSVIVLVAQTQRPIRLGAGGTVFL